MGEPEGGLYQEENGQLSFVPPSAEPAGKQPLIKTIDTPMWTRNKARLVRDYLILFVQVTRHGTYIDGFAGPQELEMLDTWAARLVLEVRQLRGFHFFEKHPASVAMLELLRREHAGRDITVWPGDFNVRVTDLLRSSTITPKEATFCLLDQRTFECHWSSLVALAGHKPPGSLKIELFYFLAQKWLDRALAAQEDPGPPTAWWPRRLEAAPGPVGPAAHRQVHRAVPPRPRLPLRDAVADLRARRYRRAGHVLHDSRERPSRGAAPHAPRVRLRREAAERPAAARMGVGVTASGPRPRLLNATARVQTRAILNAVMGASTAIEWAQATWNPVTGCTKISPGCHFCYAERLARRLQLMGNPRYANGFAVTLHRDQLGLPVRWREPRRIFVNSMSDLFHDRVPLDYVDDVFAVMERADHHVYQVLTKRAERLLLWSRRLGRPVPPHVWVGVSVESMKYAGRVDYLRQVDATVRFVSAEPLLGPLDALDLSGVSWLIAGGESAGPKERALVQRITSLLQPKDEALAWVRGLRDACQRAGVAFFFKQWGGPTPKAGGRELDGRVWSEYPPAPVIAAP
jgi:three-Cys-motif partner protein